MPHRGVIPRRERKCGRPWGSRPQRSAGHGAGKGVVGGNEEGALALCPAVPFPSPAISGCRIHHPGWRSAGGLAQRAAHWRPSSVVQQLREPEDPAQPASAKPTSRTESRPAWGQAEPPASGGRSDVAHVADALRTASSSSQRAKATAISRSMASRRSFTTDAAPGSRW